MTAGLGGVGRRKYLDKNGCVGARSEEVKRRKKLGSSDRQHMSRWCTKEVVGRIKGSKRGRNCGRDRRRGEQVSIAQ